MLHTIAQKEDILKSVKRFWFGYKVCDGCDTLLGEEVSVCPVCRAYRFDDTKERIISVAEELIEKYIKE